ncbi:SHOCT domain-containing protein, partial [Mycobacterium sp. E796]|uniref:SHOCT domain-containing protein n=1 Tax=Mycobacterium sp. E796 TaxID=1834151 RepID=UPI000A4D1DAC
AVQRGPLAQVVPRHEQRQAPPAGTPAQPSIAQRLQELETLRASGALTDQEYTSRRAQIISEI